MIKEIRDIETNELQGYEFNGMFIPLEPSNRHYQEIQELIKNGEEVIPAYTEEERLEYFRKKRIQELKRLREDKVKTIVVTLSTGEVLNGNEKAQDRINRAISALDDDTTTIKWIDYSDNDIYLTRPQFKEALKLAGLAQSEIFTDKYNRLRTIINTTTDIEMLKNGIIDFDNAVLQAPEDPEMQEKKIIF